MDPQMEKIKFIKTSGNVALILTGRKTCHCYFHLDSIKKPIILLSKL
jgi:hypothetical protein